MMILFVWGKNTLYSEALPLDLILHLLSDSDQLITVDGKVLDNVLEINNLLYVQLSQLLLKIQMGEQSNWQYLTILASVCLNG